MPTIASWDQFYEEAEKLFTEDPANVRYMVKYRHVAGTLVLKVTNDVVTLRYETDQAQDVKKVEKLHNLAFRITTSSKAEDSLPPPEPKRQNTKSK
eukprot:c16524_g1_i1.p1 GENE.c16524_g1_i1~~c16524_g1_i1.p1  ORF type:complete len:109 (-),score=23.75 c16524_g1_i1:99-386(-)